MNRLIRSATVALMLMTAMGSAQDFDAGLAAAESVDLATALREWGPLTTAASRSDPPCSSSLLGHGHRSGRRTLVQLAKSGDLHARRQVTWGMSDEYDAMRRGESELLGLLQAARAMTTVK